MLCEPLFRGQECRPFFTCLLNNMQIFKRINGLGFEKRIHEAGVREYFACRKTTDCIDNNLELIIDL